MKINNLKFILVIGMIFSFNLITNSCSNSKNASKEKMEMKENFTPVFDISNRTKFFLNDLEEELKTSNSHIDKFIPSKKIIENYNLKIIENEYHINGMVKVEKYFDYKNLDELRIKYSTNTSSVFTINIPLKSVYDFFNLEGINTFQISEKVNNK